MSGDQQWADLSDKGKICRGALYRMDRWKSGVRDVYKRQGLESLQRDWLGNPKTALNCVIFVQIWKWSGFAMAIFLAGLQGIPKDFYEAATIDGAGKWQQFKNITFPLLAPAFTVVVTMNTIGGFKVFEQVYVMTGGGPVSYTHLGRCGDGRPGHRDLCAAGRIPEDLSDGQREDPCEPEISGIAEKGNPVRSRANHGRY